MIDLLDMINSRNGCIILRLGGAADKKDSVQNISAATDALHTG